MPERHHGRPKAVATAGPWQYRDGRLVNADGRPVPSNPQERLLIEAVPELIAIVEAACRPLKIREAVAIMRRADAVLEKVRKAEAAACLREQPVSPPTCE